MKTSKSLTLEMRSNRKGMTMSGHHKQNSEVARLLAQINSEYEAARQGLSGLAQGVGQHRFITRRMEHIAELHCQLRNLVGDEAMALITRELDQAIEEEQKTDQLQPHSQPQQGPHNGDK
jgi:hypothetical protein